MVNLVLLLLASAQGVALVVLLSRLMRGRTRPPAVEPVVDGMHDTSVSVVVPARNEAARIGPCLAGLRAQSLPMIEAIVVDGGSTDGTAAMIDAAAAEDPRIRRIPEPRKPEGAVGRPWAIAAGCASARGDWVLVVDADTHPGPGMIGGAVAAARRSGLDAVSFAPRIVAPTFGARWLQPSFLTTLVYRFGPPGGDVVDPERAMANGQCLLVRRAVLESFGGYAPATDSYCDDIRIVRHLAERGARVGFLDGRRLFDVTMYETGAETWRAWPRSLNMQDATSGRWRLLDELFLVLTMVVPVLTLVAALVLALAGAVRDDVGAGFAGWLEPGTRPMALTVLAINAVLIALRVLLLVALRPSFSSGGFAFWLSPLADPATASRVIATTLERPREWRGLAPVPLR